MPTARSSAASARAKRSASAHVAAPAERRHRRPLGERRLQPRDAPALLVDADPGGHRGAAGDASTTELRHLLGLVDVAGEEDDAAEAELARERPQLDRESARPSKAGDQQLTDLTAQRARRHDAFKF